MMADVAMFIIGCFVYALRGWFGKQLLTLFFHIIKNLVKFGRHELAKPNASNNVRGRPRI